MGKKTIQWVAGVIAVYFSYVVSDAIGKMDEGLNNIPVKAILFIVSMAIYALGINGFADLVGKPRKNKNNNDIKV